MGHRVELLALVFGQFGHFVQVGLHGGLKAVGEHLLCFTHAPRILERCNVLAQGEIRVTQLGSLCQHLQLVWRLQIGFDDLHLACRVGGRVLGGLVKVGHQAGVSAFGNG